ncbi:MAG: TraR/DksA C4-type zinc finger protein [Acidimicrobiia bacterium]
MAKAGKKPAARPARKPAKKQPAKKAKATVRKPAAQSGARGATVAHKPPAKATKSTVSAKKAVGRAARPTKPAKAVDTKPAKAASTAPAKATPSRPPPKAKALPRRPSGPPLSARQLERLRALLREARHRHLQTAEDLEAEAEVLATEREPGDTQFDEESGEGDTVTIERERDLVQAASERQTVEDIDDAIARMDAGKYGVCVSCGARIPVARLEVIPWTELCVDCKARGERRR